MRMLFSFYGTIKRNTMPLPTEKTVICISRHLSSYEPAGIECTCDSFSFDFFLSRELIMGCLHVSKSGQNQLPQVL